MRRLLVLSLLLIAPASEVFAINVPLCSQVLDWHESDGILRQRNKDIVESMVTGYIIGYRDARLLVSQAEPPPDIWKLPSSEYYRLVIKECEALPGGNLSDMIWSIGVDFQNDE